MRKNIQTESIKSKILPNVSNEATKSSKTCKLLKGAIKMSENKKAYKYDQGKPRRVLIEFYGEAEQREWYLFKTCD